MSEHHDPQHPAHQVHEAPPLHDVPDTWHDHSHDERPQQAHAEVGNAGAITLVGVGLFLLIVLSVVVVDTMYRGFASDMLATLEQPNDMKTSPAGIARKEKSDTFLWQRAKEPHWVTIPAAGEVPAKNIVQLPLADARNLVVAEYLGRATGRADSTGTTGLSSPESAAAEPNQGGDHR